MSTYLKQATIFFLLLSISCKEEFIIETQDFESVLVVEATITNELKYQEVKLSRTYLLEASEQILENNATVTVVDDNNNHYNFSQNDVGIYVSDVAFEAETDSAYNLQVITTNGSEYRSINTTLPPISQINNLYAEFIDDDVKGQGIQVYVDSDNSNTEAEYFRYDYEETYQLVAPLYIEFETVLTNFEFLFGPPNVGAVAYDTEFVLRGEEQQTCYVSKTNTEIIQGSTSNLNDNIISQLPIRFIEQDDSILRDRYSILVKQYVQNIESYTFYKIINDLGSIESILSETQPGFVQGNLYALNTDKGNVIGYFDVASVSEKRLFFNYFDFNLEQPDYQYTCEIIELDYTDNMICGECEPPYVRNQRHEIYRLLTNFEEENLDYHIIELPEPNLNTIWKISNPQCTDCTTVGSNIQPDFWIN